MHSRNARYSAGEQVGGHT